MSKTRVKYAQKIKICAKKRIKYAFIKKVNYYAYICTIKTSPMVEKFHDLPRSLKNCKKNCKEKNMHLHELPGPSDNIVYFMGKKVKYAVKARMLCTKK